MKIVLVIFAKKGLSEGEWVIVDPKMMCRQNSGSAFKIFFIILYNESSEEVHENQMMVS